MAAGMLPMSPHSVPSPESPEADSLDPFRLLIRIHTVEGSQRELTMTLAHTTEKFSGVVTALRDELQRLSEIGERQVQQNVQAQERRDTTLATLTQQASELRGSVRMVGLFGGLLITLAVAYLQLQANTLSDRISRNEAAIRELQHK
jgi:hypothetical protein